MKQIKSTAFGLMVLVFLLTTGSLVIAGKTRDVNKGFLQVSFGDFKEDLETARKQGKKAIMLFFQHKDCPFCHRMKTTVMNRVSVQDYFKKHFLIFSVDIVQTEDITDFQGKSTTQKKFFAKIGRNRGATPLIAFFDTNGKLVVRYRGATSGVEEFMLLGKYVIDKQYLKMPFTRYKRMNRK